MIVTRGQRLVCLAGLVILSLSAGALLDRIINPCDDAPKKILLIADRANRVYQWNDTAFIPWYPLGDTVPFLPNCDGGAVSLKFQDFRESMPGGAGGVDDGQHGGATTIVDDARPSGTIGGQSDGEVGWYPLSDREAKLLRRLRDVGYSTTFMADTVTLVLRWADSYTAPSRRRVDRP